MRGPPSGPPEWSPTLNRPFEPESDSIRQREDTGEVTVRLPVMRPAPNRRRAVPTLRVVAGKDMLHFVPINPEEKVLIGRDEGAELRLGDPTVSKRHANVLSDAHGAITVVDLDSTNGTSVNGKPIRRTTLQPGDHLEVGAVSLRLDLLSLDEIGHLDRVLKRLEASNRDPLTGLLTRAFFDDELPALAEKCSRADVPFCCVFVDVDRFKAVNDNYGHQLGDEVLVAIGRLVMVGVRDADPCMRYGGEEIVLFLPGSTEMGAAEVAERTRKTIMGHDWDRTSPGLRITASFGVAERYSDESLKDWLRRADEAVYSAKHSGRNRVVRASTIATSSSFR